MRLRDFYLQFNDVTGYKYAENDPMKALTLWRERPILCVSGTTFQLLGQKNSNLTPYLLHLEDEHFRPIVLENNFGDVSISSTVSSTKQKQVRTEPAANRTERMQSTVFSSENRRGYLGSEEPHCKCFSVTVNSDRQ